jgi:hypothetical protein
VLARIRVTGTASSTTRCSCSGPRLGGTIGSLPPFAGEVGGGRLVGLKEARFEIQVGNEVATRFEHVVLTIVDGDCEEAMVLEDL